MSAVSWEGKQDILNFKWAEKREINIQEEIYWIDDSLCFCMFRASIPKLTQSTLATKVSTTKIIVLNLDAWLFADDGSICCIFVFCVAKKIAFVLFWDPEWFQILLQTLPELHSNKSYLMIIDNSHHPLDPLLHAVYRERVNECKCEYAMCEAALNLNERLTSTFAQSTKCLVFTVYSTIMENETYSSFQRSLLISIVREFPRDSANVISISRTDNCHY